MVEGITGLHYSLVTLAVYLPNDTALMHLMSTEFYIWQEKEW